jgi:hypothetical protein
MYSNLALTIPRKEVPLEKVQKALSLPTNNFIHKLMVDIKSESPCYSDSLKVAIGKMFKVIYKNILSYGVKQWLVDSRLGAKAINLVTLAFYIHEATHIPIIISDAISHCPTDYTPETLSDHCSIYHNVAIICSTILLEDSRITYHGSTDCVPEEYNIRKTSCDIVMAYSLLDENFNKYQNSIFVLPDIEQAKMLSDWFEVNTHGVLSSIKAKHFPIKRGILSTTAPRKKEIPSGIFFNILEQWDGVITINLILLIDTTPRRNLPVGRVYTFDIHGNDDIGMAYSDYNLRKEHDNAVVKPEGAKVLLLMLIHLQFSLYKHPTVLDTELRKSIKAKRAANSEQPKPHDDKKDSVRVINLTRKIYECSNREMGRVKKQYAEAKYIAESWDRSGHWRTIHKNCPNEKMIWIPMTDCHRNKDRLAKDDIRTIIKV